MDKTDLGQPEENRHNRPSRRRALKLLGAGAAAAGAYLANVVPEVTLASGGSAKRRLPKVAYRPKGAVTLEAHDLNLMQRTLAETGSLTRSEHGTVTLDGKPYARSWAGQYSSPNGEEVIGVYLITNHGSQMTYGVSRELHADSSLRLKVWGISTLTGSFRKLWLLDIPADRSSMRAENLETGKIIDSGPAPAQPVAAASGSVVTADASGGCDFCLFICSEVAFIGCAAGVLAICSAACGPFFWACIVPCTVIASALCGTLGYFSCFDACIILGDC
jgi:hypothetical protein